LDANRLVGSKPKEISFESRVMLKNENKPIVSIRIILETYERVIQGNRTGGGAYFFQNPAAIAAPDWPFRHPRVTEHLSCGLTFHRYVYPAELT
jgi:hypothetical protein